MRMLPPLRLVGPLVATLALIGGPAAQADTPNSDRSDAQYVLHQQTSDPCFDFILYSHERVPNAWFSVIKSNGLPPYWLRDFADVAAYVDSRCDTPLTLVVSDIDGAVKVRALVMPGVARMLTTSEFDALELGRSDSVYPAGYAEDDPDFVIS